ncbi:potassium uptake protein, TrkH family [Flavonifractor plautii]|nr:potassium uptake protein, TrkH family [Flavonifractor plautii]
MIKKCALWLRDSFIRSRSLNATRIVAGSFAAIILIGALLLTLPIASRDGQSAGFFTGLFTATSSTCVTGLILVDTWTQWTLFGQAVILTMIQLGGLGFMTVITLVSFALHRRIGLSERLIMVSTLNLNDMDGVVRVVRHALIGTFAMETAGAVLMSVCLIPEFGFLKGTWHAVFHAVSSFCNAGFDLLGGRFGAFSSLVTTTTTPDAGHHCRPHCGGRPGLLRVGGHCGQAVLEQAVGLQQDGAPHHRRADRGGALFFLMEEFDNPATLGYMPLWQKGLNALFQSVTLRTAGFDSIGQGGLSDTSKAMSCVLMLIGGSSGSTAGIKTATVGVLLLALRSGLMGREQVTFRGRAIHYRRVLNAMTLALVVLFVFVFSSMVVSTVEDLPYLDSAFEVASAMGTVGLTTGITPPSPPSPRGC